MRSTGPSKASSVEHVVSSLAPPRAASTPGRMTVASTRETAFWEMPGAAPDVMRDYDLATLGYEETEFSFEGTAGSYEMQGERGADGRWEVAPGPEAPFRTRIRGAEAVEPAAVQRDGRRRVAQRLGRHRRRARLGLLPSLADRGGACLGRRVGAEGRHRRGRLRREHPSQAAGPRALQGPGASRRRLVLRHLHAGRPVAAAAQSTRTRSAAWHRRRSWRRASHSRPPAW